MYFFSLVFFWYNHIDDDGKLNHENWLSGYYFGNLKSGRRKKKKKKIQQTDDDDVLYSYNVNACWHMRFSCTTIYTDTHTHTQPIRQTACKMQPNQRNECKKKGNEDQNDDNSETAAAAAASATITTTSQKQSTTTTTTTTTAKNIPFVWLSFCSFLFGFCLLIVIW